MIKFIFDNKNSYNDMNCIIVGAVTYPLVKEDVELITIEGRKSGSLTKKTGNYKDLTINMTLKLVNMQDFEESKILFQEWLENFKDNKLFFENANKCYKVKTVEYTDITPSGGYQAVYKVTFICNPFMMYLFEDFIEIGNSQFIYNDGCVDSEPIIKINVPSKQDIQIDISGKVFEIKQCQGEITIDSSLMQIFGEEIFKTVGNFPILGKGENIIKWNGTISKFEINKRTLLRG